MVNEEKRKVQMEAFNALKDNDFNGVCVLPTGLGKTWVMIECLKHLADENTRILYCCDNKRLRDVDFPEQLVEWDGQRFLRIMDRMCYQSAFKLKDKEYDIILCDEFDYSLTEKYSELYKNNTFKHKILVSATLDSEKRKLAEDIAPIVYEKNMADIGGQGIVNEARLHVVNYMLNSEENRKYLSFNEAFKRELNKPKQNNFALQMIQQGRKRFLGKLRSSEKLCYSLIKKLYHEDEKNKIIIFCLLSEQADNICAYSYHSKNDNNNLALFDVGEIRVLSVVGKVDRGVNLTGVNKAIFEAPLESKTKLTQRTGRLRRLAVDDVADFYFLVPFYKDYSGKVRPTVVQKWVFNSTKDLGLPINTYKI